MKPASPRFEPISPSALAHLQHEPSVRLTKPYQVLLTVNDAKMQFGERVLWEAVNLVLAPASLWRYWAPMAQVKLHYYKVYCA